MRSLRHYITYAGVATVFVIILLQFTNINIKIEQKRDRYRQNLIAIELLPPFVPRIEIPPRLNYPVMSYNNRNYFAICTCVKDDFDLEEWVEYHYHFGAANIYLYDNNSTLTTPNITLKNYIDREDFLNIIFSATNEEDGNNCTLSSIV